MSLITAEEYIKRRDFLYLEYSDMLPNSYEISTPHGWLSTLENMFLALSLSLTKEQRSYIQFIDIKIKYAQADMFWCGSGNLCEDVRDIAVNIIDYYEDLVSKKCEVCGVPGKEFSTGYYYFKLCPEHFDFV